MQERLSILDSNFFSRILDSVERSARTLIEEDMHRLHNMILY